MTERRTLPEIPQAALRDHASQEVVDRVWRRLSPEVGMARREPSSLMWWAPAAAVALFGGGIVVGLELGAPAPTPAVQPERHRTELPTPAAEPESEPKEKPAEVQPPPKQAKKPESLRRSVPPSAPAVSAPVVAIEPPAGVLAPALEEAAPTPAWQTLATQLDYDAASTALERQGGFQAAMSTASPDQLMTLHDIARATGHRANALEALRRVVDQHPNDPNAPVAAWSLANMLESSGDRVGAAQAYAAYRSLSPQGDFAEDALARQVEIVREQGDLVRARQMARQYVQEFSSGRHIEEMQVLANPPADQNSEGEAEPAPAGAEAGPEPEPTPAPGSAN